MKKVIVTTTINSPTKAIELFDAMEDWHLIVIGDLKTPKPYKLERGTYFSPEEQEKYDTELSDLIGWNCIQRRNFGFLLARDMGADVIATIDDDNIPYDFWGKDLLIGKKVETLHFEVNTPAFDPLYVSGYPHLWHRGYPLELLPKRACYFRKNKKVNADIQADFWNGDPDIDAICRMEHAPVCRFNESYFPISSNKPSPFNSQNTFIKRGVLQHYFMFPHIGRMDDIWSSYYVQSLGFDVVYNKASVEQVRNQHNCIGDMRKEYVGYENNLKLIESLAADSNSIYDFIPEKSKKAFKLYQKHFK